MSKLAKLKEEIESNNEKLSNILLVETLKSLCKNFKKIKKNHPKLENASFGMGMWGFTGKFTVKYFDGFDKKAKWTTDDTDTYIVVNQDPNTIQFRYDKEKFDGAMDWTGKESGIVDFVKSAEDILDYRFTTDFDYISEKGVGFVVDCNGTWRTKEKTLQSDLYKMLLTEKVPVYFVS